jgi:hypothetical protein
MNIFATSVRRVASWVLNPSNFSRVVATALERDGGTYVYRLAGRQAVSAFHAQNVFICFLWNKISPKRQQRNLEYK